MRAVMARMGAALAAVTLAFAPSLTPAPAWGDVVRDRQRPILDRLDVPEAWKITRGRGVTVAVVDSGVDPRQADLRGSVTVGPNMLADVDRAGPPTRAHGTGMASLIAGHGHGPGGRSGVIGIAPQSRILALRVIAEPRDPGFAAYRRSEETKGAVAKGIRHAVDHGADVINLSLGSNRESDGERQAIAYAISKGVVVVSAVGNDGDERGRTDGEGFSPYSYPASYPGVIAVAASTPGHKRAPFSNRNYSVLLSAPGVGIPSAGPGGQYFLTEGTSDASALVSGIAALIRSRHPDMRPTLVRQALLASTRFGPTGRYDPSVGFGEVNAAAALRSAAGLAATPGGTDALSSRDRFGTTDLGPVKVIDRPFWTEPMAYAVIGLTVLGAGLAVLLTVVLFRRSRQGLFDGPLPVAGPVPAGPPPPLFFDPSAPPRPRLTAPTFERPDDSWPGAPTPPGHPAPVAAAAGPWPPAAPAMASAGEPPNGRPGPSAPRPPGAPPPSWHQPPRTPPGSPQERPHASQGSWPEAPDARPEFEAPDIPPGPQVSPPEGPPRSEGPETSPEGRRPSFEPPS
ncbi:S8 family peptidase [Thermomonospora umbrina]|uniref:Type VII secretion-associated serine protease mycosin n=1 Tax=Thermomonospora umbrina TaxID=111806 RepID=A0A3D9T0E0_9ACTN|nr:S8 family serine peptidase [Thermomonospora umbrina]REE98735.1 type VII secretion-associated serine protease mycosin [Thermomonospora umbrina]